MFLFFSLWGAVEGLSEEDLFLWLYLLFLIFILLLYDIGLDEELKLFEKEDDFLIDTFCELLFFSLEAKWEEEL